MMSIELDMKNLIGQMDAITKKATDAIRPAAQAGAQVYYEAVIEAAPKSKKGHWFHGTSFKSTGQKYWFESGNLKDSIYQVFSKSDSTKDKSVYHIAWNHRQTPYGFMVAAGTKNAKANDFVSKARKSVAAKASAAMLNEFAQRIKK